VYCFNVIDVKSSSSQISGAKDINFLLAEREEDFNTL
jgi:hypothetical protein